MSESTNKKKNEVHDEDYLDSIVITAPHSHDVLCGRGGLTNQHSGNEWFRRLVRSNRALYKSCPKHTKLLVAKAIVQAVQQQDPPGRYLEIGNRTTNTWRQISYKRAVDKTSQALREKDDRVGGGGEEDSVILKGRTTAVVGGTTNSGSCSGTPGGTTNIATANSVQQPHTMVAVAMKTHEQIWRDGGSSTPQKLTALTDAALKSAGLKKSTNNVNNTGGNLINTIAAADTTTTSTTTTTFANSNAHDNPRKRKPNSAATFVKPSWWSRGTPLGEMSTSLPAAANMVTPNAPSIPVALSMDNTTTTTTTMLSSTSSGTTNTQQQQQQWKRPKTEDQGDEPLPLPTAPLENRQSSLFRFLSTSGIFGIGQRQSYLQQQQQQQPSMYETRRGSSSSSLMMGQTGMFSFSRNQQQNPNDMLSGGNNNNNRRIDSSSSSSSSGFHDGVNDYSVSAGSSLMGRLEVRQIEAGVVGTYNPLPFNASGIGDGIKQVLGGNNTTQLPTADGMNISRTNNIPFNRHESGNEMLGRSNNNKDVRPMMGNLKSTGSMDDDVLEDVPTTGLFPQGMDSDVIAPPPPSKGGLTAQVSDWLTTIFSVGKEPQSPNVSKDDDHHADDDDDAAPPPPPGGDESLARSMSSTIFGGLVESPSQLLATLRSGVSSFLGDSLVGASGGTNQPHQNPVYGIAPAAALPLPSNNRIQHTTMTYDYGGRSTTNVGGENGVVGTPVLGQQQSTTQRFSLLDDYEETPLETKLRNVSSLL